MGNVLCKIRASKVSKKGQGILELAMTLVAITVLLGGVIKIWLWSNNQIVERQMRYNESRIAAGFASDSYTMAWPVYTPPPLGENDVLLRPQ